MSRQPPEVEVLKLASMMTSTATKAGPLLQAPEQATGNASRHQAVVVLGATMDLTLMALACALSLAMA